MEDTATTDRAFARSVGMAFGDCDMCDFLSIEATRASEAIRVLRRSVEARERLIRRQRRAIGTLKLSCFAATLMMAIFAWASIAGR